MRPGGRWRLFWLGLGLTLLAAMIGMAWFAPDNLSALKCSPFKMCVEGPLQSFPFGTDEGGRPLLEYAMQGTKIVVVPALLSGLLVALLAGFAGLARCAAIHWVDTAIQGISEIMGALPRLVVVIVIAFVLPPEWRSLLPIGIAWALMAAPGAMDEAAACAGRLGGARFVEALKAHGFSAFRIYGYHVTWLNLRSVLVRQGAEVAMQVVFLEIALSYMAKVDTSEAVDLTHSASTFSWAELLYKGYTAVIGDTPMLHALFLGLGLIGVTALLAQAFRLGARER